MMSVRNKKRKLMRITALVLLTIIIWQCPLHVQESAAISLKNPQSSADGTVTWDCIYFGNYPQGKAKNGRYKKEPIKWRVLSIDGDDAFLLADRILSAKSYNGTYVPVTWETCTLRSWLNGYNGSMNVKGFDYSSNNFLETAFNAEEQSAIFTTEVVNEDNPEYGTEGGKNTEDKVFLLSMSEAMNQQYGLKGNCNQSNARKATNTAYAVSRYSEGENIYWWLRTPGSNTGTAVGIEGDGEIAVHGSYENDSYQGVRPAIHINLSSNLWSYAGTVKVEEIKDKRVSTTFPAVGGNLKFDLSTGRISDCDRSVSEVKIPETIEGIPVTGIGELAFSGCTNLKAITIPSNVHFIGWWAFLGCDSLESIRIENKSCHIVNSRNTIPQSTKIIGYKNSPGYQYVKKYGGTFIDIETGKNETIRNDNQAYMDLLPISGVEPGEPTSSASVTDDDRNLYEYQMYIMHETNVEKAKYVEIRNFVQDLIKDCSSDYEKAKVITEWVSSNIEYVRGMWAGNTIEGLYVIWHNRAGNCECYRALVNYFLYLADIPSVSISGATHAWSAALIDGRWVTIDATNNIFDGDPNEREQIEKIEFGGDNLCYIVDDLKGVSLGCMDYSNSDLKSITQVDIPKYVQYIYDGAFDGCNEHLAIKGIKGTTAEQYVKNKQYKCRGYTGVTFTASKKHSMQTIQETTNSVLTRCKNCGYDQSVVKPKKETITNLKAGKNSFTVQYTKQADVKYQIYYKTGSYAETIKTSKISRTVKKLKSGKNYSVKVRAYKTIGNKVYYGSYSNIKTVKVK